MQAKYIARSARASISQDNWGEIKQDWGSGGRRSLSFFGKTTHNICIKIHQTTVVAVIG